MSVSSIPQCPRDCFEATAKAIGCGTLEDDLNCFCLDTSAQTSATDTLQTCLLSCNVDDILTGTTALLDACGIASPTDLDGLLPSATGGFGDFDLFPTQSSSGSSSASTGPPSRNGGSSNSNSNDSSNDSDTDSGSGGGGLSTGAKAGIGIGVAVLVLAAIGIGLCLFLRNRKSKKTTPFQPNTPMTMAGNMAPSMSQYGPPPPQSVSPMPSQAGPYGPPPPGMQQQYGPPGMAPQYGTQQPYQSQQQQQMPLYQGMQGMQPYGAPMAMHKPVAMVTATEIDSEPRKSHIPVEMAAEVPTQGTQPPPTHPNGNPPMNPLGLNAPNTYPPSELGSHASPAPTMATTTMGSPSPVSANPNGYMYPQPPSELATQGWQQPQQGGYAPGQNNQR